MIAINGQHIKWFKFADGAVQIDSICNDKYLIVDAYLRSSDEIMALFLLLDKYCIDELHLKYVPYQRQDRQTTLSSSFSLRAFCKILSELLSNEAKVFVYNPHSQVMHTLLKQFHEYIYDPIQLTVDDDCLFLAPDMGASIITKINADKYHKNFIQCYKVRCPETGRIESLHVDGCVSKRTIVVIDDICDGGATFLELGTQLISAGAKELHLYVVHGIFSKGMAHLFQYYTTINSKYNWKEM